MLPNDKFTAFVTQNELFAPSNSLLLALSGGRDSVLMAHLFKAAGYTFGIAHVNFQLRGAESDQDESFCRALAEQLDVPFFVTRFDTQAYAQAHQLSIQMAARQLRYEWFEQIRQQNGFAYIALAHHQNDSIETVLLNLVRGTGISGLHGILPKREYLIRPLLAFTRQEIDDMVRQMQLSYRDDSSNESVKYARNKIRLEVIPKLKELNPALETTFDSNLKRFAELEELLHRQVAELRPQLFLPTGMNIFEIKLPALKDLKPLNTMLFELFRPFGFTESVLRSLSDHWDGHPGKVFESATHQLLLDRDRLILSPLVAQQTAAELIAAGQVSVQWHGQDFEMQVLDIDNFKIQADPKKAQLDADLLVFPLSLRSWQNGDHFYPLGMKGQKKLSDFFIEHKIPLNQKAAIGVLQNGNGDILWISGLRADERYKVSVNTKKVFILEQKP
ncbi:MAG: tRNA lysidine(34) synthetase TilS [Sphingobacteriaceae bacterium]